MEQAKKHSGMMPGIPGVAKLLALILEVLLDLRELMTKGGRN